MKEYSKSFDKWNIKKKLINCETKNILPNKKQIWWLNVGVNVGVEEDGKKGDFERPVLVIKVFNRQCFLGIPMTSTEKIGKYYHKINFLGKDSYLILSQIKLFSIKRVSRKIYKIDRKEFDIIMNKLKKVIGFK